jgi:large subunit ribosomal protein L25
MAETLVLESQRRTGRGSALARKLRRQGMVPAVLYGHKEATVSLSIPAGELVKALRHGVRILDLKTDGKIEKALIREAQWDYLGTELLHVDFARVSADERVQVTVPIEIRGVAPGIAAGGVLDQPIHNLLVECLAVALPESIRVNVGELQLGQAIHVKDLKLPEGVKALADPEALVVHVTMKQAEPEAGQELPGEGAAEPEVIGRQRAAEQEEAE